MVFGLSFMSLSGGFLRLNLAFPPILAACGYSLKWWMASPYSAMALTLLADKGVPVTSVPAFCAACMPMWAFLVNFPVILGLAASKDGYENTMPRNAQSPDKLSAYPTLFRFKSAHNNTVECLAMMAPCFWVAQTLKLDEVVFAKLSVLFLATRILYVVFCARAPPHNLPPDPVRALSSVTDALTAAARLRRRAQLGCAAHDALHRRLLLPQCHRLWRPLPGGGPAAARRGRGGLREAAFTVAQQVRDARASPRLGSVHFTRDTARELRGRALRRDHA